MTEERSQHISTPARVTRKQAMHTAVRILTHRDHSKYELKQKLHRRGFASKVIDAVIAECERFDYIDDRRTARVYISQLKRKGFGKRYIRMALKKKRLDGSGTEDKLAQHYPDVDEHKNAGKLLKKKMKAFNREEDPKKRRDKIYRFLYSRGFNKDVIRDIVKSLNS